MGEVYLRNQKVEESPLQGDLMLFDPVKSQFYVLNRTMAYVWRYCDGEKTFDGIVQGVPGEFAGSDTHPVAKDVKAALDELLAHGLLIAV